MTLPASDHRTRITGPGSPPVAPAANPVIAAAKRVDGLVSGSRSPDGYTVGLIVLGVAFVAEGSSLVRPCSVSCSR